MKNYQSFTSQEFEATRKWLEENNLEEFIENITNEKIPNASIILDDRAINFDGDFDKAYKKIKEFKPHWKK